MILYEKKNITDVRTGIVMHSVNCAKKMASGVAKDIRAKWAIVYDRYMTQPGGRVMLGAADIIPIPEYDRLYVANVYGQEYYGYDGKKYASLAAIKQGTETVLEFAQAYTLPVYLPKIGSARGGLDWDTEVEPTLQELADKYSQVSITICIWGG